VCELAQIYAFNRHFFRSFIPFTQQSIRCELPPYLRRQTFIKHLHLRSLTGVGFRQPPTQSLLTAEFYKPPTLDISICNPTPMVLDTVTFLK
jgi:hypothetical protein